MFFPQDELQKKVVNQKNVYVYQSGVNRKPIEVSITHKKLCFNELKKILNISGNLRVFNFEGAQYYEEELKYLKNKSVLYITRGEDFDTSNCMGEYDMQDKLGQGGFGNVFLAKHKQTGQNVAIKVIKTENIGSVNDIDSIFVEAEILKSLRHENIVKVINCITLKNMEVAIIMEFLQGGELLKVVEKEGKLSEKQSQTYFKQIIKGMKYCHQNNLIHRDLKLENILLTNSKEQKIKIIDFGIAGAINFFTWEDLDTGSLSYMAPQCFVNNKDYKIDGRIDVWATGVILFTMLNGFLPFKGNSNYETIEMIKEGAYKMDPTVQKGLSELCIEVIQQCLQVNPKKRISMEELADHVWVDEVQFSPDNTKKQQKELKTVKQSQIKKEVPKIKPKISQPANKLKNSGGKINVKKN